MGWMVPALGISGWSLLDTIIRSKGYLPVPLRHWPPTSGVLATLGTGPPLQEILPTTVSRLTALMALARACFVVDVAAALEGGRGHLEQGVDEPDGLGPLLVGLGLVLLGHLGRGRPGERRLERVLRAPPDLGGHAVADVAKGLDRRREQQGLAHRGDLGPEPLLRGLLPEGGPVGRDGDAGDDLGVGRLEPGDLGGEVLGAVLVAARVDDPVALLGQGGRE